MIQTKTRLIRAIALNLKNQFSPNPQCNPTPKDKNSSNSTPISLTNPKEVKKYIVQLANKKSAGHDGISASAIKRISVRMLSLLTGIYNSAITLSYYPAYWKNAIVIPVLKKGEDPTLPISYRPISLLPVLGKIFEKNYKYKID
jgi:hypothetical protein